MHLGKVFLILSQISHFHHQDGVHPDLKRGSFTHHFHELLELLESFFEKIEKDSLGSATRARQAAINNFSVYYRYRH